MQVFETRAPPDHEKATFLRVKAESLRELSLKSTEQPPVPDNTDELPLTHGGSAQVSDGLAGRGAGGGARGARGGRGRGAGQRGARGGARGQRGGRQHRGGQGLGQREVSEEESEEEESEDESEDEGEGESGEGSAEESGEVSGEEGDEDGGEDDDPPPPIPDGWERVAVGEPFKEFLLWTALSAREPVAWHRMVVVKPLSAGRRDGFTHDAHVHGESAQRKRGVCLSAANHSAGCWMGIAQPMVECSAAPSPALPLPHHANRAAAPAPSRSAAPPVPRACGATKRARATTAAPPQPMLGRPQRARSSPQLFSDYRQ